MLPAVDAHLLGAAGEKLVKDDCLFRSIADATKAAVGGSPSNCWGLLSQSLGVTRASDLPVTLRPQACVPLCCFVRRESAMECGAPTPRRKTKPLKYFLFVRYVKSHSCECEEPGVRTGVYHNSRNIPPA